MAENFYVVLFTLQIYNAKLLHTMSFKSTFYSSRCDTVRCPLLTYIRLPQTVEFLPGPQEEKVKIVGRKALMRQTF